MRVAVSELTRPVTTSGSHDKNRIRKVAKLDQKVSYGVLYQERVSGDAEYW